jgi:hypothetical protein
MPVVQLKPRVVFFGFDQFPQPDRITDAYETDEEIDAYARRRADQGEPLSDEQIRRRKEIAARDRYHHQRCNERYDLVKAYHWLQTQPTCIVCDNPIVTHQRRKILLDMRRQAGLPEFGREPFRLALLPWPDVVAALALGDGRYRLLGGLCDTCVTQTNEVNAPKITQSKLDAPGFEIATPFPKESGGR